MDLTIRLGLLSLTDDERAVIGRLADALTDDELHVLLGMADRIRSMERLRAALRDAA